MTATHTLEYHRLDAANEARAIASNWLAAEDDRRLTRVAVSNTIPADVLGLLEWREYRAIPPRSPGQIPLTPAERDRISTTHTRQNGSGMNVFHARSCKAIARMLDIEDWTAYYDSTLTVDEHYGVYQDAQGTTREMIPAFMRTA